MQSRRRRKKAGGGRCGNKIEATRFVAGLRSDQANRGRPWGSGVKETVRGNRDLATTIGGTLSRFAPNTAILPAPSSKNLNLTVETMVSSTSPSSTTTEGVGSSVLRSNDRHVRHSENMSRQGWRDCTPAQAAVKVPRTRKAPACLAGQEPHRPRRGRWRHSAPVPNT